MIKVLKPFFLQPFKNLQQLKLYLKAHTILLFFSFTGKSNVGTSCNDFNGFLIGLSHIKYFKIMNLCAVSEWPVWTLLKGTEATDST